MALASEILARAYENRKGPFPDVDDREVVARFLSLDKEIALLPTLRGLNAANREVSDKRNAILILSKKGDLEVRTFLG
jgi:putative GTP pyrophosphokinase